jgi:hypothetical protein
MQSTFQTWHLRLQIPYFSIDNAHPNVFNAHFDV